MKRPRRAFEATRPGRAVGRRKMVLGSRPQMSNSPSNTHNANSSPKRVGIRFMIKSKSDKSLERLDVNRKNSKGYDNENFQDIDQSGQLDSQRRYSQDTASPGDFYSKPKHRYEPVSFRSIIAFAATSIFDTAYHTGQFFIKYSRRTYLLQYTLIYIENVLMGGLWYYKELKTHDKHAHNVHWYTLPALLMTVAGFFPGLILQTLYYKYLHPLDIV